MPHHVDYGTGSFILAGVRDLAPVDYRTGSFTIKGVGDPAPVDYGSGSFILAGMSSVVDPLGTSDAHALSDYYLI